MHVERVAVWAGEHAFGFGISWRGVKTQKGPHQPKPVEPKL